MYTDKKSWRGILRDLLAWGLATALITGCLPAIAPGISMPRQTLPAGLQNIQGSEKNTPIPGDSIESTPDGTALAGKAIISNVPVGATKTPVQAPLLWISTTLPERFRSNLQLPKNLPVSAGRDAANVWIEVPTFAQWKERPLTTFDGKNYSYWVYALAAPFNTLADEVQQNALQLAWNGVTLKEAGKHPLLMTAETRAVLEHFWGTAKDAGIEIIEAEDLLDTAWEKGAWAIIPFEEIEPRWKIMRIDGQSPLERNFDPGSYPLAIPIRIEGPRADSLADLQVDVLPTNRDPDKITMLVMTGVTALSRHIGERMESKGLTYPARDIGQILKEADLTHISNEVSFYTDCPTPGPERADMRFCSSPKYIALLEAVGADIIELTGNHIIDWGTQPFLDTLEMYRQRDWGVYGGGATKAAARQPLLVEHNGNRIAFIGCSPSGPDSVWATADKPGSASCDFSLLEQQIQDIRQAGYLPVVTLQAVETDTYLPATAQGMPVFRQLARAGAVIVSGSQSHIPQTMTFVKSNEGSSFVHYGLGNLFFDQMEPKAARQGFIDRHIFYDGRYLGVELVTTMLEDYARPRLMTPAERAALLDKIFTLSNWSGPVP